MGENLRLDFPSSSSDRGEPAGYASESSLTMSVSSSATVCGSDAILHRNATGGQDSPTEWTDEKHNLFLESLEVSFVKQLHHSMALRGWRGNTSEPYYSLNLSASTYGSSDKNGYWQNFNLKRKEILSENAVNSHCIGKSPWVHNLKSPSKCHATSSSDLQDNSLAWSEGIGIKGRLFVSEGSLESHSENELCSQNVVGNITEFSDQNFVDEGRKNNSSHMFAVKRLKTGNADTSRNDQVVPSGKHKADV